MIKAYASSDGNWVTINGVHVLIGANGKITKGPAKFIGSTVNDLKGQKMSEDKKAQLKAKYGDKNKETKASDSKKSASGSTKKASTKKEDTKKTTSAKSSSGKETVTMKNYKGETVSIDKSKLDSAKRVTKAKTSKETTKDKATSKKEESNSLNYSKDEKRVRRSLLGSDMGEADNLEKYSLKELKQARKDLDWLKDEKPEGKNDYMYSATQKTLKELDMAIKAKSSKTTKPTSGTKSSETSTAKTTKSSNGVTKGVDAYGRQVEKFKVDGVEYCYSKDSDGVGKITMNNGKTLFGFNKSFNNVDAAIKNVKDINKRKSTADRAEQIAKEVGGVPLYTGKVIKPGSVFKAGVDSDNTVIYKGVDAVTGKTIDLDGADMGALMIRGMDNMMKQSMSNFTSAPSTTKKTTTRRTKSTNKATVSKGKNPFNY